MTEFCKVEKRDRILIVTINRPERLNALHPAANLELAKVFDEYAADDELWACLLYTSPSPRDGLLSRMPSSA